MGISSSFTIGDKGEYEEALKYYQKDLQIILGTSGQKHTGLANSYNAIGAAYKAKGNYTSALKQ